LNYLSLGTTNGELNISSYSDISIESTNGNLNITNTDINIGTTSNGINLDNNTFLNVNNLVLNTNENDGAIYMNKQDFSTNTSGDWRFRIDENSNFVIENYNGSSWITKLKLESS
jgi:hypothetical protein